MNRRGFLAALGFTAAGAATGLAVPELWTPKRTFFLPPRSGWPPMGAAPPYAYQWSWAANGSGLVISREAAAQLPRTSGYLEALVTDAAGRTAPAAVKVTVERYWRASG